MRWDDTVSIEGVATALAVLGAAIGYVINLIRAWRQDVDERAMRGVSFVILEFLEEHLVDGLSEQELWDAYVSDASASLRGKYSGKEPARLSRVDFERRLRSLQFDGMVDPVGKDRWRVRARLVESHELRESARERVRSAVRTAVPVDNVARTAERLFRDATSSWQKKEALEMLVKLDPQQGATMLKDLLGSTNRDEAVAAAELLTEFYGHEA